MAAATPDVGVGNVVPAGADPLSYPLDVGVGAGQPNMEDTNLDTARGGLGQQSRHRIATECGLEGEIEALINGPFQQLSALLPRRSVSFALTQSGVGRHERACSLVGVVVLTASRADRCTTDAALSGTIDACQDI